MLEVFAPASAGVETARARFIALLFRALILLDTHQVRVRVSVRVTYALTLP